MHCPRCFHAFCPHCCAPRSYTRLKTAVCLACTTSKDLSLIHSVAVDQESEENTVIDLYKEIKPQESTILLQQELLKRFSQVSDLRLRLSWYSTQMAVRETELSELKMQQLDLSRLSQALVTRKAQLIALITQVDAAALPSESSVESTRSSCDSSDDLCALL